MLSGSPVKQSIADVIIRLTDIDDNPPKFTPDKVQVNITVDDIIRGLPIYTANATDADEGTNAQFFYILPGNPDKAFTIDTNTGAVKVAADKYPIGRYTLLVVAVPIYGGDKSGPLELTVTITGQWPLSTTVSVSTAPQVSTLEETESVTPTTTSITTTTASTTSPKTTVTSGSAMLAPLMWCYIAVLIGGWRLIKS